MALGWWTIQCNGSGHSTGPPGVDKVKEEIYANTIMHRWHLRWNVAQVLGRVPSISVNEWL